MIRIVAIDRRGGSEGGTMVAARSGLELLETDFKKWFRRVGEAGSLVEFDNRDSVIFKGSREVLPLERVREGLVRFVDS